MKDIEFHKIFHPTEEDFEFVERVMENYYGINKEKESKKEKAKDEPSRPLF
jgi:DNA-binding cell septation regulator SpoVG